MTMPNLVESPPFFPTSAQRTRLRRRLFDWFDRNARPLPWRRSRCAYAIWVSEIMLQQTQVAAVIPYFERFMRAFPDIATLAQADEQAVLRLWSGLGYYSRARNLHRTAKILCAESGGLWPTDPLSASRLPGLGRYTVNAVLSQAFDVRLPILEANTRRLLCRILGERGEPRQRDVENRLWQAAESWLPRRRVGDFNQALMELGALVCKPQDPDCPRCPLKSACVARRMGLENVIPRRAASKKIQDVRELALIIHKNDNVLLVQRPAVGRWAKMWEFPHREWPASESLEAAASLLLKSLGMKASPGAEFETVRHGVTRYRICLCCWSAQWTEGEFWSETYAAAKWIHPSELAQYALSSPQRRLAKLVAQPRLKPLF